MKLSRLKAIIKQTFLPALILFAFDLLAAAMFFGPAHGYWLFNNTTNWIQMAADLTFTEAVIFLLIAGLSAVGLGEHMTIGAETLTGAGTEGRVDIEEYQVTREKSISFGFQLAGIGLTLILLTLLLHVVSA